MKIKTILKKMLFEYQFIIFNHNINNIVVDSREVKINDVFFAIKGSKSNGVDFIADAIRKGAKTVIYEEIIVKEFHQINYIKVENVKSFLALFAKIFYHDITKRIKLIGVTGTNGKTTVSTLLNDYLSYLGNDVLLIGTNGIFVKDEHFYTDNTTPNILKIYDLIKCSLKKGVKTAIIEASSIGIREARLLHFDFDIIIFTNIGHDHLDYHKNITDYKFSKACFMWDLNNKKDKLLILNKDDENYSFISSLAKANIKTYSINNDASYKAININKSLYDNRFEIICNNNIYKVKTSLVGGFNIYNILAVVSALDFLKYNINDFIDFLKIYISVNGRMNKICYKNKTIIIDFAHTPSSVLNVLSNIKEFSNNKLCVVIGCGGNRDITKRSEIAEIAVKYADRVIFTSDNPRDEEPDKIINDMVNKLDKKNYQIIIDRKEAILDALDHSLKDEVIAILGKGSERDQLIKGIKNPFNDKEVVYGWIKSKE